MSDLNDGSTDLSFMRDQVAAVASFASNQVATSIYHFIRQPLQILITSHESCQNERRMQTEGPDVGLVFNTVGGTNPLTAASVEPNLYGEGPLKENSYTLPYDANLYENRLFENTIAILRNAGVEHIILARIAPYPNLPLEDLPLTGLPKAGEDVHFIDVATEMSSNRRERVSQQYRDAVHLTVDGARDLSDFFAEYFSNLTYTTQ